MAPRQRYYVSAKMITFETAAAFFTIMYLTVIFAIETSIPGELIFAPRGMWRDPFGNIFIIAITVLLFGLFALFAIRAVARRREKLLALPNRARSATVMSLALVTLGLFAAAVAAVFVFLGMQHLNRRTAVLQKWVIPSFTGLLFAALFIIAALTSSLATFRSTSSVDLPRPFGPADGHLGSTEPPVHHVTPKPPTAPPPTALE